MFCLGIFIWSYWMWYLNLGFSYHPTMYNLIGFDADVYTFKDNTVVSFVL